MRFVIHFSIIFTISITSTVAKTVNYARVLESINQKTSFNPCITENLSNLTNCNERDFWLEICNETQLKQKHNDYYTQVSSKYKRELENFTKTYPHSLSEFQKFKQQVASARTPMLKLNFDETLSNYQKFFETKSKDEVYEHIKNELIPSLFLHPKHYLLIHLYGEVDRKLKTKLELYLSNFDNENRIGAYLYFIKVAYEELSYSDFLDIIKKIIAINYNESWNKIENQAEDNIQFTKIVNQKFIGQNKKNKVKNLYLIAVKNLPDALKKYLPKSNILDLSEKNNKNPAVSFKSTILERNAHYDTDSKKIVVYGGYGEEGDDAALIRAIGHELGHLIAKNMANEIQVFNSCFQSSSSINASNDELGETFADWVSAEVVARYLNSTHFNESDKITFIQNSMITCEPISRYKKTLSKGDDPHPRWDKRINQILFAHPLIKRLWNCQPESGASYCSGVSQ